VIDTKFVLSRRLKLKLTQAQAGKLAGMGGAPHWCRMEKGKGKGLTLDTLARVAKVLQCRPSRLLLK
jgi:transcriptional regulator with XRE-family HTH domain